MNSGIKKTVFLFVFLAAFSQCSSKKKCHIGLTENESRDIRQMGKNPGLIYEYSIVFKGFGYYIEKIHTDKMVQIKLSENEIPLREKDILVSVDGCGFSLGGAVWDIDYSLMNCIRIPEDQKSLTDKVFDFIVGPPVHYNMFKLNFLLKNPKKSRELFKSAVVFRDGREMIVDIKSGNVIESKPNRWAERISKFKRIEKVEGQWTSKMNPENEFRIVDHHNMFYFFGKKNSEWKRGGFAFDISFNVEKGIANVRDKNEKEFLEFNFINDNLIIIISDNIDSFHFKKGELFYRKSKNAESYAFDEDQNFNAIIELNMNK